MTERKALEQAYDVGYQQGRADALSAVLTFLGFEGDEPRPMAEHEIEAHLRQSLANSEAYLRRFEGEDDCDAAASPK